jgi:hypothetical protein
MQAYKFHMGGFGSLNDRNVDHFGQINVNFSQNDQHSDHQVSQIRLCVLVAKLKFIINIKIAIVL